MSTFDKAYAFAVDMHERARVRAEINASDATEALKTVLGFLVDPIGAAVDAANREMTRRKENEHGTDPTTRTEP
jgi:hypothetical protein